MCINSGLNCLFERALRLGNEVLSYLGPTRGLIWVHYGARVWDESDSIGFATAVATVSTGLGFKLKPKA